MGCLKLGILEKKFTGLKVVYRKPVLEAKGVQRFIGVDPLAELYAPYSSYNYVLNNPVIHTDPDGRSVDYEFKQQKDGSYKKISNNGGLTNHTFRNNDGTVTHSDRHGTYTVNPGRQKRSIKAYAKQNENIRKNGGKFTEGIGTTAKYAGLIVSILGFPEVGIPLSKAGQALEFVGVGIQVGQDIANDDLSGAAKKVATEIVGKKLSDVGGKFLNDGLGEASTAAKVLNVVKEVNVDAAKKGVSEIDK